MSITPISWSVFPTNTVIQEVYSTTNTYTSLGSTAIPLDDSIPQVTEGVQCLSCSITPKFSTSIIKITVSASIENNTSSANCIIAIFANGASNAISARVIASVGSSSGGAFNLIHYHSPGTTSTQTYTVRVGTNGGYGMYINGDSSSRLLGGAQYSSIILEEIKQ